ncbi:MAG TPA: hypothetical protein PLQ97_11660 [Myxococcota bacterium]|nr:hypothetical protein [Myxococcota bacterium]HQK51736.1 hypothetical protein [Myxococcota bacterium]
MDRRNGEKVGWLGGWAGAFLWVLILAVLFLVQGRIAGGLSGIALAGAGMGAAFLARPWRHGTTPYRWLLLAPMGLLVLAIPWAWWSSADRVQGGDGSMPWTLLPLVVVIGMPLWTVGRRRWKDGEPRSQDPDRPPGDGASRPGRRSR